MAATLTERQPVEESTGRPTQSRRRARLMLAAVLVVALLGWVGLSVTPHGSKSNDVPVAPTVPSETSPLLADDVTWAAVAGMSLPVSRLDGPRCLTTTGAACFSRSARGAAFAAVHLVVRCFPFVGPAIYERTIGGQVVGAHRSALLRLTRQAYADAAAASGAVDRAPLDVPARDAVAGYRVVDFDDSVSPSLVQVALLVRQTDDGGSPSFTQFLVHLRWVDGDWRLEAPDWGDWRNAASPAALAASAFTPYDVGGEPR